MASDPFTRRSWATQSLRVTAKELSLVSGRGRNTAIAERFSKYQRAAEELNTEKKKPSFDSATPSLRSGNLSALKKRWEQPENLDRSKPPYSSVPPSSSRCRPPALARPPSITETTHPPPQVKSPAWWWQRRQLRELDLQQQQQQQQPAVVAVVSSSLQQLHEKPPDLRSREGWTGMR
ncbi:hypothetical protein INR49_009371 [Caranx melampygus]|nr:hypothetical protein INR49_009371 [Caranx melampygus]